MSTRIPALLALLLTACTAHDGPKPLTPTPPANPPTDAPVVITTPTETPVVIATPTPTPDPPITSPDPPPLRTPPPPADSPAAITLAIASAQITRDCPDEPSRASERDADRGQASIAYGDSEKQSSKPIGCEQSTLQLSLQNTGGRAGKLEIKTVRVLDGASKRVLATLPSRKPARWLANGYQPWDEQVPGNTLTQATYRLGEPTWSDGGVHSLDFQPYFVEIVATIDGRKQTVRSAEIVPRSMDMVET